MTDDEARNQGVAMSLTTPTACPDPARWHQFLGEHLPAEEMAQLVQHVDTCSNCQRALDALTAAGASWLGLAGQLGPRPEAETALQQAMERLGAEAASAGPATAPGVPEELPLDFLRPSDNPEHLGRLGHYEVLEVIGRGGMGVVLKAFDPALQRIVAIKVLAPPLAVHAAARKRFIREAQAAAAINHDHVVTIHAVDEADGLPYLVMQYVAGRSLEQHLNAAEGPLELKDIVRIGRQTAAGLAAAHAQGLIHRDIKPANILLEVAGVDLSPQVCDLAHRADLERVRITDFGLARAVNDASTSQSGVVAGTPLYMSPEQIAGGAIDHRSDLYSLGVLLYRMAAGREPFADENLTRVWSQHLFERPPSPSEVAPAPLPPWLEHLILRLLQKDPGARPQTAEEVIQCFDQRPGGVPLPPNEEDRLAALRRYRILDTDPEQSFDDLTFLASHVCGTPIALITLVDADRQWFKSKVGLSLQETARNISFCTHTILQTEVLMVRDAQNDERFACSALVCADPHVRFYAGIPLITPEGHALGAMCVMDRVPRQLSPDQVSALAALSRLVLHQLELRRDLLTLKDAVANRERKEV
jgi:serine/threonine protein kinase